MSFAHSVETKRSGTQILAPTSGEEVEREGARGGGGEGGWDGYGSDSRGGVRVYRSLRRWP